MKKKLGRWAFKIAIWALEEHADDLVKVLDKLLKK